MTTPERILCSFSKVFTY